MALTCLTAISWRREPIPQNHSDGDLAEMTMSERPLIRLLVVTPDDVVIDQKVVSVRFQQPDGWQGILARHAPYLTQLVNGVLMYRLPDDAEPRYLALYGGTLEVQKDMIVALTPAAEPGDNLEVLIRSMADRQAQADKLAVEAHIELTRVRAALVRALIGLPAPAEAIQ
jgi:F0F1-type ATP synthase epsilon subunit